MVSKITIFEPHFDGAQFGPASLAGEESAADPDVSDPEVESKSRVRTVARALVVIVGVSAGLLVGGRAIRRARSSETPPVEVDERPLEAASVER